MHFSLSLRKKIETSPTRYGRWLSTDEVRSAGVLFRQGVLLR